MKKTTSERDLEMTYLLSDYGKQKLLNYADSFKALAKSLHGGEELLGAVVEENSPILEGMSRQTHIYKREMQEKRILLAENLEEMAEVMSKIAGEVFSFRPLPSRKSMRIKQLMRMEGILIQDIYYVEEEDERFRVGVRMHTERGVRTSAEEAADMLSVILNERLMPSVSSPSTVDDVPRNYIFVEEADYVVLTGVAKAIKEGEERSGDNYAVIESEQGRVAILLSDGMGSGEKACADSEEVLDLMEKLMEAGYDTKTAAHLINSALLVGAEAHNMSTLDICDLNLYTGVCEFVKLGAAATFIKRDRMVEQIYASTFPLGMFKDEECNGFCRRLIDGDYVIMVTDGVMDAFEEMEYGEDFASVLGEMNQKNPRELAEALLQLVLFRTGGHIWDDLTILVFGIWENK